MLQWRVKLSIFISKRMFIFSIAKRSRLVAAYSRLADVIYNAHIEACFLRCKGLKKEKSNFDLNYSESAYFNSESTFEFVLLIILLCQKMSKWRCLCDPT